MKLLINKVHLLINLKLFKKVDCFVQTTSIINNQSMLLVTSNQNRQLRLRVQLFIYPKKIDVKKYSEVKTVLKFTKTMNKQFA